MGDFLKSAMNYFNTVPSAGGENDFVGQVIEVQALKLRIKRKIAEGKSMYFLMIPLYNDVSSSISWEYAAILIILFLLFSFIPDKWEYVGRFFFQFQFSLFF